MSRTGDASPVANSRLWIEWSSENPSVRGNRLRLWRLLLGALAVAIFSVSVVAALFVFLQFQRVDVVNGDYHGLTIGDTKEVAFGKIGSVIGAISPNDSRIFFIVEVDEPLSHAIGMDVGRHAMVQSNLNPHAYEVLRDSDLWRFYIGASYLDSLTLQFCDERLCRVSRVRRPFELP